MVATFDRIARNSGYGLLVTPLFEDIGVFVRGVGEHTDVVTKEMYDFSDKGGRHIALRPEVTAQVARAFIQHRPLLPWKVRYGGPQFRYERPQAGRYRQFFQVGAEALGSEDPDLDVEVIALGWDLCESLAVSGVKLWVNSLGDKHCRGKYREVLVAFLAERAGSLCAEHSKRWESNPLRVLDCKKPECKSETAAAPWQIDHLCPECESHWSGVRSGLDDLEIPYEILPRLVRGLDYYTRTTFEFTSSALDGAQNAVGGGGRYGGLIESLGGPPTPGIGLSMGVDRLMLAVGPDASGPRGPEVFVVDLTGGGHARRICGALRRQGIAAERAFDARSLKAQLRSADRVGARFAAIVGEAEAARSVVTLREMEGERRQVEVAVADLAAKLVEARSAPDAVGGS